jgi:hypothetical protein
LTPDERAQAHDALLKSMEHNQQVLIRTADENRRMKRALRAIIERADTDKPGTSKVQDMRRIAVEAVGE